MENHKRKHGDGNGDQSPNSSQPDAFSDEWFRNIIESPDWYTLFKVKRGVSEDDEEAYRTARAVRSRLLRMTHPDRSVYNNQADWERVNKATAKIHELWKRVTDFFVPLVHREPGQAAPQNSKRETGPSDKHSEQCPSQR
eukprot:199450-Rhodomonas_salina.3